MELDSSSSEAQSSLACVLARYRWQWEEGCAAYERALELNPNDAETCCDYGVALLAMGQYEEGARVLLTAPEWVALVGGLRVLGANYDNSASGVFTEKVGVLSNNFFKIVTSMDSTWQPANGASTFTLNRRDGGAQAKREHLARIIVALSRWCTATERSPRFVVMQPGPRQR